MKFICTCGNSFNSAYSKIIVCPKCLKKFSSYNVESSYPSIFDNTIMLSKWTYIGLDYNYKTKLKKDC